MSQKFHFTRAHLSLHNAVVHEVIWSWTASLRYFWQQKSTVQYQYLLRCKQMTQSLPQKQCIQYDCWTQMCCQAVLAYTWHSIWIIIRHVKTTLHHVPTNNSLHKVALCTNASELVTLYRIMLNASHSLYSQSKLEINICSILDNTPTSCRLPLGSART